MADSLSSDLTLFRNGLVTSEWEVLATFRGVTEGDVIRFAFPKPEPLRTEHEQMLAAINGLRSDVASLSDGLRAVATAEQLLSSSAHGVKQYADSSWNRE